MSSTFEVPIIPVILEPHPNAETLSIVRYQGYQIVVKTEEFKNVKQAAFIPPDSVVPDWPEWNWLGFLPRHRRIKVRKFRGEWSHGLLTGSPEGAKLGDNVADILGITPYEPPSSSREGDSSRNRRSLPWYRRIFNMYKEVRERPRGKYPYYDIENFRKLQNLFQLGEPIIVTEKIHGANALYTSKHPWHKRILGNIGLCKNSTKIYMRSRTVWKHPLKSDWWQETYRDTPGLRSLLYDFPGISVYGEVYGRGIQELDYGVESPQFVGFDIWEQGSGWMDQYAALCLMGDYSIPTVPILYTGKYQGPEHLLELLERHKHSRLGLQNGTMHVSEGLVIQSLETRKILKLVSDYYLEGVK